MTTTKHALRFGGILAIVIALILAVLALPGCGGGEAKSESSSNENQASSSSSESTSKTNTDEDITVTDIEILESEFYDKVLSCTVTNNTDDILWTAFKITGTFPVKDNYGDTSEESGTLSLFCTGMNKGDDGVVYLKQGDNHVEFIPIGATSTNREYSDDVVYEYTGSKGDTQKITLEECTDIEIAPLYPKSIGVLSAEDNQILDPDDYEITLENGLETIPGQSSEYQISAQITNKTDYKWKRAYIGLVAVGKDGEYATFGYDYKLWLAKTFDTGPLMTEYVKPDSTEEISPYKYDGSLHVDHFEVTYVLIEKDNG